MRKVLFIVGLIVAAGCNDVIAAIFQRDSTAMFKVVDFEGNPISNAAVRVNTFKCQPPILWARCGPLSSFQGLVGSLLGVGTPLS